MENRCFGQNLVKLRKERHLSQNDLAIELNVTISAISKWENNKNMPDIDMLKTLSKFFEIPLDELLHNPNEDFPKEIQEDKESEPVLPDTASTAASLGKRKWKPIIISAAVLMILLLTAVTMGIYTGVSQQPTMPFQVMNSRTVEDEVWNETITEIGIYYEGTLSNSLVSLVSDYINEEWHVNGEFGASSVKIVKIYFYNKKSEAKEIAPNAISYLFLFDKNKYPE